MPRSLQYERVPVEGGHGAPYFSPKWDSVTRIRAIAAFGLVVTWTVGVALLLVRRPGCPRHHHDQWCIDVSMYSPHVEAAWVTIGLGSAVAALVLLATVLSERRSSPRPSPLGR